MQADGDMRRLPAPPHPLDAAKMLHCNPHNVARASYNLETLESQDPATGFGPLEAAPVHEGEQCQKDLKFAVSISAASVAWSLMLLPLSLRKGRVSVLMQSDSAASRLDP